MEGSSAPGTPSDGFSSRDLATILFKRRWLALTFAVGVGSVALAGLLLRAPVYESSAKILVRKGRAEVPAAPKDSPVLMVPSVTEQDLSSEVEILKSRWLTEQTVVMLQEGTGLPEQPDGLTERVLGRLRGLLGRPEMPYADQLVVILEEEIKVEPVGRSSLIRIAYRAKDPVWARRVVQTVIDVYVNQRHDVFHSTETVSFFEEQMLAARRRLVEAEGLLQSYVEESGITMVNGPEGAGPIDAQKNVLLDRMGELEDEVAEASATVEEKRRQLQSLERSLQEEPEHVSSSSVLDSFGARLKLGKRELADLEARRNALQLDPFTNGQALADLDAQISAAQQRIVEAERLGGSIGRDEINDVHTNLKTQTLLAQMELEGQKGRYAAGVRQLSEISGKLVALNQQGLEAERLSMEAETARDVYLLYQKKHEEARISSAMDQEKIVNVSIAQAAERPLTPLDSRLPLMALLAVVFAVAGGVGLAFGVQLLDPTLSTPLDVERKVGIELLAAIPDDSHAPRAIKRAS